MPGYSVITLNGELYHHGILGQKWGVRRYQNKDGSLTAEGYKRYSSMDTVKLRKELSSEEKYKLFTLIQQIVDEREVDS